MRPLTVRSGLLNGYLDRLSLASTCYTIRLVKVPSHSSIAGSYKADELVGTGTLVSITVEWQRLGAALDFCGS